MSQKLTTEFIKESIFDAFKDVSKGNGLGARECTALDDYADEINLKIARDKDVENHWWEYPEECKINDFGNALNYNNREGILFHLPALMTAEVEGLQDMTDVRDITVHTHLCEYIPPDFEKKPHHGHSEYLDYLKSITTESVISYYGLSSDQVHAISLYLLWQMHNGYSSIFEEREAWVEITKQMHECSSKYARPGDYTLTLEEAIAIVDEEHRIVRDWFSSGSIEPSKWDVVIK